MEKNSSTVNRFVTKQDILRDITILDIADEAGILLTPVCNGNFDYKCVCPSKEHKHGGERTGSLFIDSINNNFYCFGCLSGTNCIDFYMLINDYSFGDAFLVLKERAKPTAKKIKISINITNTKILLEISKLFRKTMLTHPKDLKWINKIMMRTDFYIESIESNDLKKSKALLSSLEKEIYKRYFK